MLKISYTGYSALSSQFTLEMCAGGKNCEKFHKTPILRDQSRSRSSTLINLKSPSPVLVMIGNMYVPICNRFHAVQANSVKITSF